MRQIHFLQEKEKHAQKSVEENWNDFHIAVVAMLNTGGSMHQECIPSTHCYNFLAANV